MATTLKIEDTVSLATAGYAGRTGVVKSIDNVVRGTLPWVRSGILVELRDPVPGEARCLWVKESDLTLVAPRPT